MGRAQVNANADAPLVRVGGLTGFGNLKKCHAVPKMNKDSAAWLLSLGVGHTE